MKKLLYGIPYQCPTQKQKNECILSLNRVLKIALGKIPGEQIKAFQECLIKYLEKPFSNDFDTAPQPGLFREPTLEQGQIMFLKMLNQQKKE